MIQNSNQQIRSNDIRYHEQISKLQSVTKTFQEKIKDVEREVFQFNNISKNINKASQRIQRQNAEIAKKVGDN